VIRMHNLPEHIKEALKPFYSENEKPDVFPSKFNVDGRLFYYFTFAPDPEQLILMEDGNVPRLEEIKREALIFNSYNGSIETMAHIGGKWARSGIKKNYQNLMKVLDEIKNTLGPLSSSDQEALDVYKSAAKTIVQQQEIIEDSVKRAGELLDYTNKIELVTVEDQKRMRTFIVDMCRAAYKQNEIQMQTEQARNSIWKIVSNKRWPLNLPAWILFIKLFPYQRNMMKNTKESIQQMQEINMVTQEDLPLEQHDNAQEVIRRLRNS
jgi:hypothetical protein